MLHLRSKYLGQWKINLDIKESLYNHVTPFENMKQPLLAIWRSNDKTMPPAENHKIIREAIKRGDNKHAIFQFILMSITTCAYLQMDLLILKNLHQIIEKQCFLL